MFLGYCTFHKFYYVLVVTAGFTYLPFLVTVSGFDPGAPLTYFNDGGGPKDFIGSDILAKRDFFGSVKDAGIFLGRENNTGIFLGIVFFISSNQQ